MLKPLTVLLLVAALWACNNQPATETPLTEPTTNTAETPATVEPTLSPIDLNNVTFMLKAEVLEETEAGMPRAKLYLVPSTKQKDLFLAEDVGGVLVNRARYEEFGIPDDAILAIESYYAGGGNYYYVTTNKNILYVRKAALSEPQPAVESPDPTTLYQPFKRFSFYEEEVIEEKL
jgi:hypothetical protein